MAPTQPFSLKVKVLVDLKFLDSVKQPPFNSYLLINLIINSQIREKKCFVGCYLCLLMSSFDFFFIVASCILLDALSLYFICVTGPVFVELWFENGSTVLSLL